MDRLDLIKRLNQQRIEAGGQSFNAPLSLGSRLSSSEMAAGIPVQPLLINSVSAKSQAGVKTIAGIQGLLQEADLAAHEPLIKSNIISREALSTDSDIYQKQLSSIQDQLDTISKTSGMNLNLELMGPKTLDQLQKMTPAERLGMNYQLGIRASMPGGDKHIRLPFGTGTMSTYGSDIRIADSGSIISSEMMGDLPNSSKVLHGAKFVTFNEAVMANIFKTLKSGSFSSNNPWDNFRELNQGLKTTFEENYSAAKRLNTRATNTISSIHDLYSLTNVVNTALTGKTDYGYDIRDFESTFKDFADNLGNVDSPHYKLTRGISELEAEMYPLAVQKTEAGYILRDKNGLKTVAGALDQYNNLVAKKVIDISSGSNRILMTGIGSVPEVFGYNDKLSKSSSLSAAKAVTNSIPFEADIAKAVNLLESKDIGVKLRYETADMAKEVIDTISGKYSSVSVKHIKVIGGIEGNFLNYLQKNASDSLRKVGSGFSLGDMTVAQLMRHHEKYTMSAGGYVQSMEGMLRSFGLPSQLVQAGGSAVLNRNINPADFRTMRDKVIPFDLGERPGMEFSRLVESGTDVFKGQKIGVITSSRGIEQEILSPYSGRIMFQTADEKVKAVISEVTSLYEQPSVVLNQSKVTLGDTSNGIAQQILESDVVRGTGNVRGAGAILSNISNDKEAMNLSNIVFTPNAGTKDYFAGVVSQEDLSARQTDQTTRRVKAGGPDRLEAKSYYKDMHRFSRGIRHSGLTAVELHSGVGDVVAKFLHDNNVNFTEAKTISNALKGTSKEHIVSMLGNMTKGSMNPGEIMNTIERALVSSNATPYQMAGLRRALYGMAHNLASQALAALPTSSGKEKRRINRAMDSLSKYESLTKAGGSMDQYQIAIQSQKTNPREAFRSGHRDVYVAMNRALINPEYGKARLELEQLKRYGAMNSPEARILRGGMLLASPTLPGLPNKYLDEGRAQGLLRTFSIGNDLFQAEDTAKQLQGIFKVDNLRDGMSREVLDDEFNRIVNKIDKGKVNRGFGLTSFQVNFKGKPKERLEATLANMIGQGSINESDQAIARNILNRGIFISSNDLLGLTNMDNRFAGQFLRQREKLVDAITATIHALGNTPVGVSQDDIASKALKHLVGVVSNTSREIYEKMGSEQMIVKALEYETKGVWAGVLGDTEQVAKFNRKLERTYDLTRRMFYRGASWDSISKTPAGNRIKSLAEEAANVYINPDDYLRTYGSTPAQDAKNKITRYAFFIKDPNIALSSETVSRVLVDDRIVSGKFSANPIALEYKKSDQDMDTARLIMIDTDTAAGKKAAELGIQRTVKLNQEAIRHYGFDAELIKVLKRNDDISSSFKLQQLEKDLRAAEAQSNHGVAKSLRKQLNLEYGPKWYDQLKGTLDYSKETGRLTNKLNQFNATVLKGMESELEAIAKGVAPSPQAKMNAAFISALNFAGEAKIRAFKAGAGEASAKATNLTGLLDRLLKQGQKKGARINIAGYADEMTDQFLDTFGFDVSKYINGKDGEEATKLLKATFGDTHTQNILDRVKKDAAAGRKTYALNVDKQSVYDEAFSSFLSDDGGFRFLERDKLHAATTGAIQTLADAQADPTGAIANTLRVSGNAPKKMKAENAQAFLSNIIKTNTNPNTTSLYMEDLISAVGGYSGQDIPRAAASAASESISVKAPAQIIAGKTEEKLANAGLDDIIEARWFSKMAGGIKGGLAGAVLFGLGAAAGASFGSGNLQPLSPLPYGQESGSVNRLPPPPTYLRDESGYDTRSRIRGDQTVGQHMTGFANATGRDANIVINDRSLSEPRYAQQYEHRASGRF